MSEKKEKNAGQNTGLVKLLKVIESNAIDYLYDDELFWLHGYIHFLMHDGEEDYKTRDNALFALYNVFALVEPEIVRGFPPEKVPTKGINPFVVHRIQDNIMNHLEKSLSKTHSYKYWVGAKRRLKAMEIQ